MINSNNGLRAISWQRSAGSAGCVVVFVYLRTDKKRQRRCSSGAWSDSDQILMWTPEMRINTKYKCAWPIAVRSQLDHKKGIFRRHKLNRQLKFHTECRPDTFSLFALVQPLPSSFLLPTSNLLSLHVFRPFQQHHYPFSLPTHHYTKYTVHLTTSGECNARIYLLAPQSE